jgi:hypothetical protein
VLYFKRLPKLLNIFNNLGKRLKICRVKSTMYKMQQKYAAKCMK